jgi:hypothetical protein
MPFAGKNLSPREVAAHAAKFWTGVELVKAVATFLGESQGSLGAYNDNMSADGALFSRDCGLAQINLQARLVGKPEEARLRTTSTDPADFEPVIAANLKPARALYDAPWKREGKLDKRRWQPWYAYSQGWATFPEWWIWARPWLDHWAPTGRYIQQAIVGVANYRLLMKNDLDGPGALSLAQKHAAAFGVPGQLDLREKGIYWRSRPRKRRPCPPTGSAGDRSSTMVADASASTGLFDERVYATAPHSGLRRS